MNAIATAKTNGPTVSNERLSRLGLLQEPAGYVDGQNLYQYVGNSPATLVDPSGMVSEHPLLNAGKMFLNRVLGIKFPPLFAGNHPVTGGAMPLTGGILWGLAQAYADQGKDLTPELIAKRAAEFGAAPAITYSAMAYYFMTGSKTALSIAKAGGVFSRASLYAAAFYTGFQIGDKWIMGPIRDLQNEAWFYRNTMDALTAIKSQGELLAGQILKDAPKICYKGREYQLSASFPPKSANAMIKYFGLATYSYGYKVWADTIGDTYQDFKAKAKAGGTTAEDPKHFTQLLLDYEDAMNKYAESVAKELDGIAATQPATQPTTRP